MCMSELWKFMWPHVSDRYYAGKGEIMRRAIVGNLMGVKSVMLLVLALTVMVGAGPAPAQDLQFKTMTIDYFKFGASTIRGATWGADATWGTVDDIGTNPGVDGVWETGDDNAALAPIVAASAILCASDTDADIFKDAPYPDGRLDTSKVVGGYPVHVNLLKQTIDRPIIANIERGEQLNLAAIIEGVTEADVAALRAGSGVPAENVAMSTIINMVTADFSSELFGNNTAASYCKNIHPTFATSTFDIRNAANGGVYSTTSVIVYWNIAGFNVNATSSIAASQSFCATMAIFGGGTTAAEQYKRVGRSNFVSVETGINSAPYFLADWSKTAQSAWNTLPDIEGDYPRSNTAAFPPSPENSLALQKGYFPGVNLGVQIKQVLDTTSNPLFGVAGNIVLDPRRFVAGTAEGTVLGASYRDDTDHVPFQLRKGDIAYVQFEIQENANLSGEPYEYFGANSDTINFASTTGAGLGKFIGGSLAMTAWKPVDMGSVFEKIHINNVSALDGDGQRIVDCTATVADTVITSGTYRVFVVKGAIQDEVKSATEVSTTHAVDTAPPYYTQVTAWADRGANQIQSGDIGTVNPDADTGIFGFEIEANGERTVDADIPKWVRMGIRDIGKKMSYLRAMATLNAGTETISRWCDFDGDRPAAFKDNLIDINTFSNPSLLTLDATAGINSVVFKNGMIKNIPGTALVLGVSCVVEVINNVTDTINSGGLIVSVSDDARNPALIYYPPDGLATSAGVSNASALMDTTRKGFSITNLSPTSLTYNTILPATVEIDNSSPEILVAQLTVRDLPQGYWSSGTTQSTFDLLKSATESRVPEVRNDSLTTSGVIRGAVKSATQGGSPLRLVIKFSPSLNTLGDDGDGVPYVATNASERIAGFNRRFSFDIANKDIGFATSTHGVNVLDGGTDSAWNIVDATIEYNAPGGAWDGVHSTCIGYVTFESTVGLQKFDNSLDPRINDVTATTGLWDAVNETKLVLSPGDSVWNYEAYKENLNNQNTIFVDTLAPIIVGASAPYFDPSGTIHYVVEASQLTPASALNRARTALYITQVTGSAQIPSASYYNNVSEFATLPGYSFLNSETVNSVSATEVKAGYTIIVSATFSELGGTIAGVTKTFFNALLLEASTDTYANSGFPFLLGKPSRFDPTLGDLATTLSEWSLDSSSITYGNQFKTIAADFSDFIAEDYARAMIPQVTASLNAAGVLLNGTNPNVIANDQIVAATWFFWVDGSKSLNLMGSSNIRMVTLTARDLSGNVNHYVIPAATAAFAKPAVTILDYEINNPIRGYTRSVIQRHSSYLGGADNAAAFSLSQATMNVKSASVMIVAKIGDGISKGGPYISSNFVYADLSCFGGSATAAPNLITNPTGGVISTGSYVGPADVLYATWWTSAFDQNESKDTGGAVSAKVSIMAIASSLGEGKAESSGIQVDHKIPNVAVGDMLERTVIGYVPTHPGGDQNGDGIIRPNQTVSFNSQFTMDAADKANPVAILFKPDLSQFNNPSYLAYYWSDTGNTIRGVTYEFVVPGTQASGSFRAIAYATDAAGNYIKDGTTQGTYVTVNSSRPEIQSIVLSASNVINYATDHPGIFNRWRDIGIRMISKPNEPTILEPTALIRAGDALMVTAAINISDNVFTDLNVYADFSKFSGDAFSHVVPAPIAQADAANPCTDTIQQGTHVAGSIYYATWIHYVQPSSLNLLDASIHIVATNPAGIAAVEGPMSYSVPVSVDNKGPVVTQKLTYFKNGVAVTGDEVNPNDLGATNGVASALQPGRATAELIVSATYEDAGTRNGFASGIFSAMWFGPANLNLNNAAAQNAVFRLSGSSGVTQTSPPQAALFAFSRQTGVVNNQGSDQDGEVISSATPTTLANQAFLKGSTHTVLNIWWGKNPTLPFGNSDPTSATAVVLQQNIGKTGVKLVANASDVIGNKTTATEASGLEIDGWAPQISIGNKDFFDNGAAGNWNGANIGHATLDVAPGQVPLKDYMPAEYAGAELKRPTRVTKGTIVRLQSHIFDGPDTSDPITFSISGKEFGAKASSFVVISPTPGQHTPQAITGDKAGRDKVWQTVIDPNQFTNKVVNLTVDIPIGLDKSTAGNSTIPYNLDTLQAAIDLPIGDGVWRADGYHNRLINQVQNPGAGDKAALAMDATDTVKNWTYDVYAPLGVEIDTQGPGVVDITHEGEFISFLPTKEKVDELFTASSYTLPTGINAGAGNYLVWAATLVVDGTNDADFPMDKFLIDWSEKFEFDVPRLDHTKHYTGKKYLVTSATRSIIYVTNAIKIRDDADPRNATKVNYRFEDMFGNETKGESDRNIAISSQGPTATEISIKVDGKAQNIVGPNNVGIGNKGPDSLGAKFEIYPGAAVVVEATITTIEGQAPDTLLLDISDLYPIGMKTMTDELIPSATMMTGSGMIYAKWEYLAYDMANLLPVYNSTVAPFAGALPGLYNGTPLSMTRTIFDQSNLNYLVYGKTYPIGDHASFYGGKVFNGPVVGATPAQAVDLNGVSINGGTAGVNKMALNGGPRADSNVLTNQAALNSLIGLPYVTVQKDATAKKVAWVTIFVDDLQSDFDAERAFSSNFTIDTEPPRASIVFNVTQALPVMWRFLHVDGIADLRIGFPTAPNSNRGDIFDPAPRVREGDSVAVIVRVTNELIDRTGNDAFRNLPGLLPSDLSTGFFRIEYSDKPAVTQPIASTIRKVTADLSGLSTLPGMNNLDIFDVNAPVANPAYPNMLTILYQGPSKADLITATYTLKVSADLGKTVQLSNDPVDVTVAVSDDAGNRPNDTPYDKNVLSDYYNTGAAGTGAAWINVHPDSVLAVDNVGPFISGSVQAQIISGTAMVDNPVTLTHDILGPGAVLQDQSIIAAGSVLRVTVTVTDQVDHPLDLLITQKDPVTGKVVRFMGNYGEMMLKASGLKLADSRLVAEDAKLSGPDSISVPFQVTVPSKEAGKSTFSFRFICQATDTIGNMSEKTSTEMFAFDANPDVTYSDSLGQVVSGGSVKTINAGSASQFILSASAIDVGGVKTVEWVTSGNANVTFSAKDKNGADVPNLLLNAGDDDHALLDLFALVPIVGAGIDPFAVKAVVTDIDNNINEESIVTFNINQPPIFAASFPYDATNDSNIVKSSTAAEVAGIGYNPAFADIREVTIEEGTNLFVKINATDANVADVLTFSATGTAITSPVIIEGTVTNPAPGSLGFSFKPGFLAVTGEAKSATFGLDLNVSDGTTILPDTARLVFNVLAKSATPIVTITSIKIDGVAQSNPNTVSLIELKEGSKLQVAYKGQDPGNEKLVSSLEAIPVAVQGATEVIVTAEGIVYATFTYTAGLQDADVPELSFDSPVDPFIANFAVANASYSSSKIVPVDIINVSQAPIISATAIVNIDAPKAIADGGILKVKPASQVIVQFKALDPDGDAVLTTYDPVITGVTSYTYTALSLGKASFESMLTVMIPEKVTPEEVTTTVVYTAGDITLKERTFTFQIVVEEEVIVPPEVVIDQLIVAQGFGGKNAINFKNIDPAVTTIDGKTVAVNSTYRSVAVASGAFLEKIGGGADRAAYAGLGDIDDDGDMDLVLSMGSVTIPDATYPNIVVVKDAKTRALVGNSFVAFPVSSYAGGDTPIAVGNFIGSATADQIATAQGFGGNNIIRIYQYTGQPAPYGFAVIAQFDGLTGTAVTINGNGGLSLAAGDLSGDGVDELIVGQTNSATSRTQFTVIGLNANGTINYRFPGVAFTRKFQGNGGINIAVADLDGNGSNELLFASTGNTKDFVDSEDGRNTATINVIAVHVPIVTDGKITGFTRPTGFLRNVFTESINPSGAQFIASIEGDGTIGSETVLGTNAVLSIDGTTITPLKPAPQARYTVVNVDFNGIAVTGISKVLGQAAEGLNAFPPDLTPTSGGVNVIAGQIE